jgi:hypothetical protein
MVKKRIVKKSIVSCLWVNDEEEEGEKNKMKEGALFVVHIFILIYTHKLD